MDFADQDGDRRMPKETGDQGSSRLARLRARHRWLDRLARAVAGYRERNGDHYAAAITFFSVLSLVPLLMVGASVAGFVVAGNQELLARLDQVIGTNVPGAFRATVRTVVETVIEERGKFGVFGLLVAIYSGWSWISNLRDAATAMWKQPPPQRSFLRNVVADVATLLGLGVALLVSVGLTALGGAVGHQVLVLLDLDRTSWAPTLLTIGAPVLAVVVNAFVLLWILARLPRQAVPFRGVVSAALVGAVGFEILKHLGNLYLVLISHSPAVATLGGFVGLLLFAYLVARLFLLVTVWAAVGKRASSTLGEDGSQGDAAGNTVAGLLGAGAAAATVAHRTLGK
jgi:membrane protein